jgi:hypothetical protein
MRGARFNDAVHAAIVARESICSLGGTNPHNSARWRATSAAFKLFSIAFKDAA